ncbi:hypothetical protein LDENG_00217150 [Lucifuga dentata]|nr:hypothetical protein LDENG_00217150 [Lucifuga dentata]
MDVLTDAGFYMTLPSNASKDVFKNNTSSSYTVDLAKAIELNREWVFGRGGYFDKPKELLEQIVPYLRKYDPTANSSYNNVTKCIDFKGSGQYKIRVYAPLTYMLGLKDGEWWTLSHCSAPYPSDLKTGIYNLFVYTDIIQYQQVSDSHAPLLGVVNVRGDFGDVVSIRHNTIHYLRLLKNYIKSIHIEIKTDRNRCMDFVYGRSIVKLHFRPATPL